jgi:uncharacterized OsmC-like protein
MTSKQLAKKLLRQITDEYVLGSITDEQFQLVINLHRSFETIEERTMRIKIFGDVTEKALKSAVKYNKKEIAL